MTTMTKHKWSRADIRAARRANLPALLRRQGMRLRETGGGNFELCDRPGLIIKAHYWHWPQRDIHGNAIDLFVTVLGRSFNQAMESITTG